jgi:hypothetical protein
VPSQSKGSREPVERERMVLTVSGNPKEREDGDYSLGREKEGNKGAQ